MKKALCLFCDGEASLEYYLKQADPDEVYMILAFFKVCTKDARAIDEANQKREIERSVA